MDHITQEADALTRRTLLRRTSLLMAGAAGAQSLGCARRSGDDQEPAPRPVRIGLVTDVHYADKDVGRTRHYRASLGKLSAAVAHFNEAKLDFVAQLGDFIDAAETVEQELDWLDAIREVYAQTACPQYHVLGNHCVDTLTKAQFMTRCGMSRSYYAFDLRGFHFIVLDACFREDGEPYGNRNFKWTDANIPPAELEWLDQDLRSGRGPVVVFVHQRLDVEGPHAVRNAAEVRERLEASQRVRAVFQGHHHVNDLGQINGITYCTLAAMVEGDTNAFAVVTLDPGGAIRIEGHGRQSSWLSGGVDHDTAE